MKLAGLNAMGANELSLVMIDLDNFKLVNDTYGHGAGDGVLITVAQTIREQLRQSDILARYGGEEFVILLPQTNLHSAKRLCERLQESMAEQIVNYDEYQISIQASFGVTKVQNIQSVSLESVYKLADKALYRAKQSGGNTVCISETAEDEVKVGF